MATLYQAVSLGANDVLSGAPGDNEGYATKFTTASDYSLTTVDIVAATQGSPADGVYVEIQTDNSNSPSGSVVATSATIPSSSYTGGTCQLQSTTISGSLPAGTYWFVMKRTGSEDPTNNYVVTWANSAAAVFRLSLGTWASFQASKSLAGALYGDLATSKKGNFLMFF
jgi:hypothetical protein